MSDETIIPIFGKTVYGRADAMLLGGKGAHLAEMHTLGIAVPPLVNLTTEAYRQFTAREDSYLYCVELAKNVFYHFLDAGSTIGVNILVSVRSGSPVSMPGMMDTILNVGLSLETQEVWEEHFGARWFWDCYSRLLIQLTEALGVNNIPKHDAAQGFRVAQKVTKLLVENGQDIEELTSPVNAMAQAIDAVFVSWDSDRANIYRSIHAIPHSLGTACSVQRMVFGNLNDESGTGVMFTRDPSNGINLVTGEFLVKAQGEDVVDGSTTPMPLNEMSNTTLHDGLGNELLFVAEKLEVHYSDMQDVEFTIENGKLWILQTRNAKRTSEAAFRVAVEMVDENMIEIADAIERITVADWYAARGRSIKEAPEPNFTGLAAGTGIAVGRAVFTSTEAEAATDPVILVRPETVPNDIAGMYKAQGIVTFEGGMTSHAAVVARGMNTPCVVGVSGMAGKVQAGDVIVLESSTGRVWINADVEISDPAGNEHADKLMLWAQSKSNRLARRSRYAPFTVLQVSAMEDEAFLDMVSQVEMTGAWYDGVVLDIAIVLPFTTGEDTLSALAVLSVPHTIAKTMKHRISEIKRLASMGFTTLSVADVILVTTPANLIALQGNLMKIDVDGWRGFLGPLFDMAMEQVSNSDFAGYIIDFISDEDALVEVLFGEK